MQLALGFGALEDMAWVRAQLQSRFGSPGAIPVRTPVGQLVKSMISSRTRDAVSLLAYERLVDAYPEWRSLAAAPIEDVQAAICEVTFPDVKARHLGEALRVVATHRPDFDLDFLAHRNVDGALAWLEALPGVGRKVAASTLNFSTLAMPAFVVDTHVLRILRRFGFVRSRADALGAYEAVMAMSETWSAADLVELHVWIKRLGQTICRSGVPDCSDCPIRGRCKAISDLARHRITDMIGG